jgi:hypothetical protein
VESYGLFIAAGHIGSIKYRKKMRICNKQSQGCVMNDHNHFSSFAGVVGKKNSPFNFLSMKIYVCKEKQKEV